MMVAKAKKTQPARKPAAPKQKPAPARKPAKPAPRPKPAPKPKPAAEPIDYTGPAYLSAYDAETARVSAEQVREVYRLKSEFEAAHELAAGLKKQYEAHRTEHLQYVRERCDKRGKKPDHLFAEAEARETMAAAGANGKAGKKGKADPTTDPEAKPPGGESADWYPDDLWQRYPLDRLKGYGLTDGDLKALDACVVSKAKGGEVFAPIDTLGALTRFTEPKSNGFAFRLTDIKGIGPAAVERISNATTAFWSDWPASLQEPFAVEKGYRRPDPLAEETPADETAPRPGKRSRKKRDGYGGGSGGDRSGDGGDVSAVPDPADAPADLGAIFACVDGGIDPDIGPTVGGVPAQAAE